MTERLEHQVVTRRHWRTQAWKNGGGVTHEVARADDAGGMRWRISIAEITTPGPFSRFEGVERHIALVSGNGFRLHHQDGRTVSFLAPLAPYAFAGEDPIDCTLVAGTVRDFNVMVRRDVLRAEVARLDLEARPELSAAPERVVFVRTGELKLAGPDLQIHLGPWDTLVLRGPGTVQVAGAATGTEALAVGLTSR